MPRMRSAASLAGPTRSWCDRSTPTRWRGRSRPDSLLASLPHGERDDADRDAEPQQDGLRGAGAEVVEPSLDAEHAHAHRGLEVDVAVEPDLDARLGPHPGLQEEHLGLRAERRPGRCD